MADLIWRIATGLHLPRHLIATVMLRLVVAACFHSVGPFMPVYLAGLCAFIAHVALLMAVFGLFAHCEAMVIAYSLTTVDGVWPRLKAILSMAKQRAEPSLRP